MTPGENKMITVNPGFGFRGQTQACTVGEDEIGYGTTDAEGRSFEKSGVAGDAGVIDLKPPWGNCEADRRITCKSQ
jgi:hypothetical protein